NGDSVDINGVKWESDLTYRVSGNNYKLDDIDDFETEIAATDRDALYRSYMSSGNDLQAISYRFPLSDGRYTVRLHFVEKFFSLVNRRVNDILLEGEVRTAALDVFRLVGQDAAYFLDYDVDITDGRLDLRINPSANRPAIAGIEIYQFTPKNGLSLEATQILSSECGEENGSITVNLLGDTNPVYRIGAFGSFQASGVFENLAPGTYKVYARGNSGCDIFADFVVGSEASPIDFTVATQDISCNSFNDGSATISGITGGVAPYSVIWNNNSLTTGNIVGDLIESNAHFVTVTDSLGCSKTVFFEIDRSDDCPLLINVGGTNYLSQSGELFFEDVHFQNGRAALRSEAVALTSDDPLYQSYRFATGGQDLNYSIPLATGLYDVTLFFQEITDNLPGDRQFDIDMEGTTVETNFDIVDQVGGQFTAIEKEYTVAVTDGRLNIDLKRGNTPILSAIKLEESGKPSNDAPYLANPIPDQETTIFIN
ncbi:MAG: malectin domain-containing carbohydrate-binding protein, partial [Bacteroidota bacterium]